MKTRLFTVLILSVLATMACDKASSASNEPAKTTMPTLMPSKVDPKTDANGDAVKAAVQQLLDLAKTGDCAAMAPMIALSHTDTPEDWKRGMNYQTQSEKVEVDKQCAKLQVIVTDLKEAKFTDFSQEKESEGEWNIWVVDMRYEDGSAEERTFAMLKQGNGYILGDID